MNLRKASSHSDTPMCQIWPANVNYWPDKNLKQSDRVIPIYPLKIVRRGYNTRQKLSKWMNVCNLDFR